MPRSGSTVRAQAVAAPGRPVREAIVVAGMEMVQCQGLSGLTQARVAQAAGVRQSHLTYYFPTRKDLLKALAQAMHEGMVAEIQGLLPLADGSADCLQAERELLVRRIRQPLMARLMVALHSAADEDASLRQWLLDFNQVAIRLWADLFGRAGLCLSADELAWLHATVVGAATLSAQAGTPDAADQAARVVGLAFDRAIQQAQPVAAVVGRVAGGTDRPLEDQI